MSVLSLEFPQVAVLTQAPPPTSDEEPPDETDTRDKSCTSYNDSCELVLMSKLDKLLSLPPSRIVGWTSKVLPAVPIGVDSVAGCWCVTSVLSSCCKDAVLTSGAVLTDPTERDEEEGELTIRSKLSSVELIEVLLLNCSTRSIESMLLLIDEQQLSSIVVEECARAVPVPLPGPALPLVMNRFTSRSGLSIEVDEITESCSVQLLVEGNRVCFVSFGVGGVRGVTVAAAAAVVIVVVGGTIGDNDGGKCVCVSCCCCGCCCTSTGGEDVFVATDW